MAALQKAWGPESAAFRLPGLRTTHLGMAAWTSSNVKISGLDVQEQCRVYSEVMAWLVDRGVRSAPERTSSCVYPCTSV